MAARTQPRRVAAARTAALTRWLGADSDNTKAARADTHALALAEQINTYIADNSLTDAHRVDLVALLTGNLS